MTNSEIDIAIAKALGAKTCSVHLTVGCCGNPVLNFSTDLNAMRQAQCDLTDEEKVAYCNRLTLDCKDIYHQFWRLAHVPAHQRAEAFLRVKGLWRDEAPEFGCQNIVTKG